MILKGNYQDVVNLTCTCRRLFRIGSELLTQEYQRIVQQPPSLITPTYYSSKSAPHDWIDTQGHLHSDQDPHQSFYTQQISESYELLSCQQWFDPHGRLHRDGDLPAVILQHESGQSQYWYRRGLRHRSRDRPAIVTVKGDQMWYRGGLLHPSLGPIWL